MTITKNSLFAVLGVLAILALGSMPNYSVNASSHNRLDGSVKVDCWGMQTGTVSGRVFKSTNLDGLPGATVRLKLGEDDYLFTETDTDGFYAFTAVPAGTGYCVRAWKDPHWLPDHQCGVDVSVCQNTSVDLVCDYTP